MPGDEGLLHVGQRAPVRATVHPAPAAVTDRVDWMDIDAAIDRLTQQWDRDQARALVDADIRRALTT